MKCCDSVSCLMEVGMFLFSRFLLSIRFEAESERRVGNEDDGEDGGLLEG